MGIDFYCLPFVAIIVIGFLAGCPKTQQPEPEPRFTAFSVSPANVRLNVGLDFVRVAYEFDPDGWSNPNTLCVDVLANGQILHTTEHHQCLSDGTSGELTFRPTLFFGSNVPSTIEVSARLVPSIAGETKDTRSAAITTQTDCPPPDPIPNP